MRILIFLLICAVACGAQTPEDQVRAVYAQLEKCVQTGDANHAFVGLWSRAKAHDAEQLRSMMSPQPNAHYTASKIYVQGDQGALLGQYAPDGFLSLRFIKEDGRWKVGDMAFSDSPYPPETVYAMIPPATGAFKGAGEPWQNVPEAVDKAEAARHSFQVRVVHDESFLYIRIELPTPMTAPGTLAEKPPMGWPVMKVNIPGAGEFTVNATANIGDKATFDHDGRANSHRHYVAYWLLVQRRGGPVVLQAWDPSPLIEVGGNALEVRVPLRAMGVKDAANAKITVGDAQWPKSVFFSVDALGFR